jgi:CBS domain-containing protein
MNIERLCRRDVTLAYLDELIHEIARRMRERHVGSVIVVSRENGRAPIGVLTDRDIVVEVLAAGLDYRSVTVGEVMTREPATVREDDDIVDALRIMRTYGVRRLPVVSRSGALAGIVAIDDLLEFFAGQVNDVVSAIGREQSQEAEART